MKEELDEIVLESEGTNIDIAFKNNQTSMSFLKEEAKSDSAYETITEAKEIRRPFARYESDENRTYDLYKAHGLKPEELSNTILANKLNQINEELDVLLREGENRFLVQKNSTDELERFRSSKMCQLIEKMQQRIQGYLSNQDIALSDFGEEVDDILKNDPDINMNNMLKNSLINLVRNNVQGDSDEGVNFEIMLEKNPTDINFTEEIGELERAVSQIKIDHNNVRDSITRINGLLPSLTKDNKVLEGLNKKANMLKKELDDCNMHQNVMLGYNKSKTDSAYNEVEMLYKIAQRAIYESEPTLMVLDRLKAIKRIHDDSMKIEANLDQIQQKNETINEFNQDNKQSIKSLKADMATQFDEVLKELDDCAKQIASKS